MKVSGILWNRQRRRCLRLRRRLRLADRASTEKHSVVIDFETVATDFEHVAVEVRERRRALHPRYFSRTSCSKFDSVVMLLVATCLKLVAALSKSAVTCCYMFILTEHLVLCLGHFLP